MILGFTGTRNGLTPKQRESLLRWVRGRTDQIMLAVHGGEPHADMEFQAICESLGIPFDVRPSFRQRDIGQWARANKIWPTPTGSPLIRNRHIVAQVTAMVACPSGEVEQFRGSGTWATIRYTRQALKPLTIIYPNGAIL